VRCGPINVSVPDVVSALHKTMRPKLHAIGPTRYPSSFRGSQAAACIADLLSTRHGLEYPNCRHAAEEYTQSTEAVLEHLIKHGDITKLSESGHSLILETCLFSFESQPQQQLSQPLVSVKSPPKPAQPVTIGANPKYRLVTPISPSVLGRITQNSTIHPRAVAPLLYLISSYALSSLRSSTHQKQAHSAETDPSSMNSFGELARSASSMCRVSSSPSAPPSGSMSSTPSFFTHTSLPPSPTALT